MRIIYYTQHVLGIGHVHRSLEICRAFSSHHEVTMVVGGPPLELDKPPCSVLQLPGLRMDREFSGLHPCNPEDDLNDIKQQRRAQLLSFFAQFSPDCLITELYPLGRKAFRFELDPLLEAARNHSRPCLVFCSLRDILVEKMEGRDKFEKRAVETLNNFYDGLLVHADSRLSALHETFSKTEQLQIPIHYTGYITPKPDRKTSAAIRRAAKISADRKLVVASIGSGSVGGDLLEAVGEASLLLPDRESWLIQTFTGPYCPEQTRSNLRKYEDENFVVRPFSNRFIHWLAAADLSISMAGYNTCMNILAAGVPALLLPFDQNREQRMRIEQLTGLTALKMLKKSDLAPAALAELMVETIKHPKTAAPIQLDGAERTLELIESWRQA